ncbi:MAG: phosphatase PAP2 family protein [Prolixibacteraceae bacterium]|jgi:undecaprenyl-diphosphatase
MEYLNNLDTKLFLAINGLHNAFFDPIMYWFSDKLIWVPMYLLIVFLIIRHYKMRGLMMLLFVGILIGLCDQTASHLIKNLVQRLRPSHEPALFGLIHLSKAGSGGLYGFVSSHAAKAVGLATFLYLVLDDWFKGLKYWLFIWALLVSYSRIYNGVHYPGDVIGGAVIGLLLGWAVAKIYRFVELKYFSPV